MQKQIFIRSVSKNKEVIVFNWTFNEQDGQLILDTNTRAVLDDDGMGKEFSDTIIREGFKQLNGEDWEKFHASDLEEFNA